MTNLEPKYNFAFEPCEKFNKFMVHFKHFFNPTIFQNTQNKNM